MLVTTIAKDCRLAILCDKYLQLITLGRFRVCDLHHVSISMHHIENIYSVDIEYITGHEKLEVSFGAPFRGHLHIKNSEVKIRIDLICGALA
jgi:hypothetical protein